LFPCINPNIHFHKIIHGRVYFDRPDRFIQLRWIKATTRQELTQRQEVTVYEENVYRYRAGMRNQGRTQRDRSEKRGLQSALSIP